MAMVGEEERTPGDIDGRKLTRVMELVLEHSMQVTILL